MWLFWVSQKSASPVDNEVNQKNAGKKREKSDFKGNVVPQQEQDEYTSFTADFT